MNALLKPGASILGNLSFRGKFTLIGAILFGVIAVLTAFLVHNLWAERQTLASEQRGVEAIRKVVPILIEVQKHRGLNSIYLGGDSSVLPKLQQLNAKQDELFSAAEAGGIIRDLGAQSEWETVKADWKEVRDRSAGYSKPQSFAEHTRLVATIQSFVIQLADLSGVTLDPMMDTYYLQDTSLVKLISLSESIGKLRAKGAGILAAKASTPDERAEVILLSGNISGFEKAVHQNLDKATAKNPLLKTRLNTSADKISALIASLQQTVKNEVLVEVPSMAPTTYFEQATETIGAVLELYHLTEQALVSTLAARESKLSQSLMIDLVSITALVLLSVYCFMAMSANISEAVREIDNVVDGFSQGDLTRRVRLACKDEMGNIAHQFNMAADRLRAIMVEVDKSAEAVFSATATLQSSSRQISGDSEQESESVQATAAAIEEITVSISHVADSSREASNAAATGAKISESGVHTVHQAAAEMNSIATSISHSATLINGLNERARQISSIVGVIRDIADQTNLLALNAAIEAARAGEQGRGFAVVADEVRKLAERTGNATGEITAMIGDIQRETANAVSSMETGSAQASRGVQLAEEAAASLAQVNAGSHDTRVRIEEIAEAMREQSAATTDIAQNLERISVMSETSNREVQNAILAINQLEKLAEQLRLQVATFKV